MLACSINYASSPSCRPALCVHDWTHSPWPQWKETVWITKEMEDLLLSRTAISHWASCPYWHRSVLLGWMWWHSWGRSVIKKKQFSISESPSQVIIIPVDEGQKEKSKYFQGNEDKSTSGKGFFTIVSFQTKWIFSTLCSDLLTLRFSSSPVHLHHWF